LAKVAITGRGASLSNAPGPALQLLKRLRVAFRVSNVGDIRQRDLYSVVLRDAPHYFARGEITRVFAINQAQAAGETINEVWDAFPTSSNGRITVFGYVYP
jgi:hypothetical protein